MAILSEYADLMHILPAKSSIEDCYKDISLPFGHELVLYTMLTEDPKMWPWKKYQTFNF